jgi:hypothetical protein
MTSFIKLLLCALLVALATGCATNQKPYDYTAFRQNQPKSIVVLPPLNNSPDIRATYSFLSTVTYPLAEAGYYVFPVALVDQTFKENGLTQPADMHQAPVQKLAEIFGADAALYITVEKYGAVYTVINSAVVVTANAKLVDLKTGVTIWNGQASASSEEGNNQNNGGLLGALIAGIIKQAINNAGDRGRDISAVASQRLLSARPNGILYGPRSAKFGKDAP